MPKRIQDIFATRRLKAIFDFTGSFRPQLDETIVPVVVLETFQISDTNRGPIEAIASGRTVVSIVGQPAWIALVPAVQFQIPPIRAYLPVYRIIRLSINGGIDNFYSAKITPSFAPTTGIQDGTAIWQDRRFSPILPDGFLAENNVINTVLPAGGIRVWNSRYDASTGTNVEFTPKNLIISPGQTFVAFTAGTNRDLDYTLEWQELDPEQTGTPR